MIFKVLYQSNKLDAPRREATETLYIEADSVIHAREQLMDNTPYRIDFIQELTPSHLEYEQTHNQDFKVVTF